MSAAVELHLHDQVTLLVARGELRRGSVGRVLGRYARPIDPRIIVSFDEDAVTLEVPADELELHRGVK